MNAHPAPNTKGTIVLGSTSSDPHVVPLFLVKLLLEENGYRVVNLRCFNAPQDFIAAAKEDPNTCAIVISNNNGAASEDLAGMGALLPAMDCAVPVVLGGRAWLEFTPTLEGELRALGVNHFCKDFDALLATLSMIEKGAPCHILA